MFVLKLCSIQTTLMSFYNELILCLEFVLFDRNLTVNELIGKEIVCIDHLILPAPPGSSPGDQLLGNPDPGLRDRLEAGPEPSPGTPQPFILTFKNVSIVLKLWIRIHHIFRFRSRSFG